MSWKKIKRPCTLSISVEYLLREDVFDYVRDYCIRNKIEYAVQKRDLYGPDSNERELSIAFKSSWQRDCFLNRARAAHPYFEFC